MSSTPPRRPSTLSAAKYSAAQRPIGGTPDSRASARPAKAPIAWSARPPAPVRRIGVSKGASTSEKDGQIVTSLIVTFVLIILVVASVRVRGSMRVTKSQDAVTGTLKRVHEGQSTFRLLNQRFATWRELEARGMRLPADQAVVKSNATASHWFVSVRHKATGVICDKTGELFDQGPDEQRPICRGPGK